MKTPQEFRLDRYPRTKDRNLQAWNAADEYLIDEVSTIKDEDEDLLDNILIVNDQFGALCICLDDFSPQFWTDSFLSKTAIEQNAKANLESSISGQQVDYCSSLNKLVSSSDRKPISKKFSLVIMRIPKHLSLLEYQLSIIQDYIDKDARIIAGGMTKEIHNSTIKQFEKLIGPTKTSLAKKKSRLIYSQLESEIPLSDEDHESKQVTNEKHYVIQNYIKPEKELTICGLPGVYSRDSLDMGTRILLQNIPSLDCQSKCIDLGCGAGVIGATLAQAYPDIKLTLTDESGLAIESSRRTFEINELPKPRLKHTDVLEGIKAKSFDFVFCNPPFHQQNTQSLSTANKMFRQSARALIDSGELYLVANRHLKYGKQLNKYFKLVTKVSEDKRFIIWKASKPIK